MIRSNQPPLYVTVLPTTDLFDGMEVYLDVSAWAITGVGEAVADVIWHLRYSGTTTKWHYVGGSPLISRVNTSENRAVAAAYAALATAGPGITVAAAGDYLVQVGSIIGTLASFTAHHSYDVGGTGAVDADAARAVASAGFFSSSSIPRRKSVSANTNFLSKYKAATTATGFENRWMSILPIRLG